MIINKTWDFFANETPPPYATQAKTNHLRPFTANNPFHKKKVTKSISASGYVQLQPTYVKDLIAPIPLVRAYGLINHLGTELAF